MMKKVYILLPVHNRCAVTERFVDCLAAQTYKNYHLILVDDGSTDGTAEMVQAKIIELTVLKGSGDWWWAGGLQQGIDWLHTQSLNADDVVLFINDDSVIDENFIELGCQLLQDLPSSMLQARVLSLHTNEVLDIGMIYDAKRLQFHAPTPGDKVNCLTTNGLFVRWEDLERVGGFHPRVLPHYLSDYEFTIRAGRKGLELVVMPQLSLHWDQETTGSRSFPQDDLPSFLKAYFSRKSAANPLYWTSFVFLASPLRYLPLHIWGIWKSAAVTIATKCVELLKAGPDCHKRSGK
jgi:GT2 family glycosyltransferase